MRGAGETSGRELTSGEMRVQTWKIGLRPLGQGQGSIPSTVEQPGVGLSGYIQWVQSFVFEYSNLCIRIKILVIYMF